MSGIEIISVHVTAIVNGERVEKHFTPSDKGLPGLITEVFRNIKFYLLHNTGRTQP